MSFSADWLALRHGADMRARDLDLAARVAAAMAERAAIRVLDLGAGTGANLAALAPQLKPEQHWRLADNDEALLERVKSPKGVTVERCVLDLAADLDELFAFDPDLVTASAFFDICGQAQTDRIIDKIVARRAAFYTVLTYDGRETWEPANRLDVEALAAFHADQRRDKGLGPALGPVATDHMAVAFKAAGYRVWTAPSDWQLSRPGDSALIEALADGSAAAIKPVLGPDGERWRKSRRKARKVMIGHQDLLALPE